MKKSFVLLIVLFLLSAGTVGYAASALLGEQDNVQFTENVLYGDASVVEGVTVERNIKYESFIYWNSICMIGELPETITTCNVYEWGRLESAENYMTSLFSSEEFSYWEDCKKEELTGIAVAYRELSDSLEPGKSGQKLVYLKDYMDYYQIEASINLPEDIYIDTSQVTWQTYTEEEKSSEEYIKLRETRTKLNDFFKIPVLKEERRLIEIEKDDAGGVILHGNQTVHGCDSFWFGGMSVYTDTDCYITFNTHTVNGNIVDTSQIPGGYGIYGFSYDSKNNTVDMDSLKLVYALDPTEDVVNLQVDAKGEKLLLSSKSKECNKLTVIDIATMQEKASFTYGESVKQEVRNCSCYVYEDFLILNYSFDEGKLAIVSIDENGDYTYEYDITWDKEKYPDISDITYSGNVYDWDGERLLFATSIWDTEEMYIERCGFLLGAFDENGMLYLGTYESSLDTGENGVDNVHNYACEPTYVSEIEISW